MDDETQDPMRRGVHRLKNGALAGNPHSAPRCGARTRAGSPCRAPAVRNRKRCRLHGGRATGPRTAEGLERLRAARTTHGGRSQAMQELLRRACRLLRDAEAMVADAAPATAPEGGT